MTLNLFSETPGFFASISTSALYSKYDILRAWNTAGQYKDIPRRTLCDLVKERKIKLYKNKAGQYYVPSIQWIKYF